LPSFTSCPAAAGARVRTSAANARGCSAAPGGDALATGTVSLVGFEGLEQIALDGYLAGLGDAGWQGNPDLVRFGYAATLYWRYVFGAFVGESVTWMLDERYHAAIERATGHTMEEGADYTALLIEFYQHVYGQVQELKAALD